MKYERLTIKRENGFATVRNTTLQGLIDRLASLEDKIESGELCDRDEVRKETARTCIILAKQYQNSKEIVRDIAEKYSIDLRNEECEERRMKDHEERYIDSLFIAFDEMGLAPTTVCPDPEKYAIEWREKVRAEFERLENENAALRERLDNAGKFPCKAGDIIYQTDTNGTMIFKNTVKNIIFETDGVAFDERAIGESIFLTEEAVKEKMKKLQEKRQ